jgi:hypothetical protein
MFRHTDSDHWITSLVVTYVLSCCHTVGPPRKCATFITFYCCAKGHFFTCAGVGMSSAIPAVLTMTTAPLSLPPQHNPANKQHLRYGHGTHSTAVEGYSEQERAQLALIQRFLAGGFSLGDNPCQSPPRCADSLLTP